MTFNNALLYLSNPFLELVLIFISKTLSIPKSFKLKGTIINSSSYSFWISLLNIKEDLNFLTLLSISYSDSSLF